MTQKITKYASEEFPIVVNFEHVGRMDTSNVIITVIDKKGSRYGRGHVQARIRGATPNELHLTLAGRIDLSPYLLSIEGLTFEGIRMCWELRVHVQPGAEEIRIIGWTERKEELPVRLIRFKGCEKKV